MAPRRSRPTAVLTLALGLSACGEPAAPTPPPLTEAARQRLGQFAEPSTWEDLDGDRPGTRLRDPRTGVVFRRVPKGEFEMGDDGDPMTKPRHRVVLTRDYLLAETELTVGQWRRAATEFALDPAVPIPAGDDAMPMPLCCLDAEAFALRFGYRLPTEAEWERACCGGLPRAQEPWTNEAGMREHAWFHRNSDMQTHAVGQKRANPYGLFDMLGNLWEWCGEDLDPTGYGDVAGGATDPFRPPRTPHRVLRGGSWFTVPPASPRTRMSGAVDERTPFFGARFARDVAPR